MAFFIKQRGNLTSAVLINSEDSNMVMQNLSAINCLSGHIWLINDFVFVHCSF